VGRRIGSVDRTPEAMRKVIDGVLRTNRMTVDELREHLASLYPEAEVPSRSALYRYKGSMEELTGRLRDIQTTAETVVADLGENPDEKAGALLVQCITALAADAALKAQMPGSEVGIEDLRKLARATRDVISARTMSLKERQQIEEMARQKLLREQSERLDKVVKSGGLSEDTAADLRRKILGIG
jgi:hypothetical protein